jgi:hypothetical protein
MNRTTLDLVEESVRSLQRQSAGVWLQYLLGAVPFLLALLAFEHDMTSSYNESRCAMESLLCALLFLWLNVCKARFGGSLLSSLSGEEATRKRSTFAQCLLFQTTIQTTKLFALPLAAVAVLPFSWVSSFYRNATLEADRPRNTLSGILRQSRDHASSGSRANWIGLLLFTAIGFVVWVNIFILLLLLPQLTRSLTGSESDWTRNAAHTLNWQTTLEAVALTWFVIDPVLQSFAALRCFYAEARSDGRDLLANLRKMAVLAAFVLLAGIAPVRLQAATVSQTELDRSIDTALTGSEYRWHLASDNGGGNLLQKLTHQIGKGVTAALKHVDAWMRALDRWFRKLFSQSRTEENGHSRAVKANRSLPWIVGGLAAVIALALIITIVRKRLQEPVNPSVNAEAPAKANLSDQNLLASDVPEDEWLQLARDYVGKGEFRLAIRAMYLSNLAALGQRQLIVVTRWKSNRLYERELQIRSRASALCEAFASSNRDYERAWFGLHEVTRESIDKFEGRLQAIRAYGKS